MRTFQWIWKKNAHISTDSSMLLPCLRSVTSYSPLLHYHYNHANLSHPRAIVRTLLIMRPVRLRDGDPSLNVVEAQPPWPSWRTQRLGSVNSVSSVRLAWSFMQKRSSHRVTLASPSTQWPTRWPNFRLTHAPKAKPPFQLLQRHHSSLALQMHAPTRLVLTVQLALWPTSAGDRKPRRPPDSQCRR